MLVLGVVAIVGIRESARVTNALVVVKVAICVFVIVAGAFFVKGANLTPFVPPPPRSSEGASGLKQPLGQALFGSSRRRSASPASSPPPPWCSSPTPASRPWRTSARRPASPARDLPLGLLGTLGICTVLYIGVSFVHHRDGQVRPSISEGAPIANAFEQVGLGWAATLVSIAAIAGLTSVILVDIVAMGRIGFAMGRDRLLPPAVAKVHPKWGTPYRITMGTIVLVAMLAGFVPLERPGRPGQHRHAVRLRRRLDRGAGAAPHPAGHEAAVPGAALPRASRSLSALACLYLMTNLALETWLRFLVWMVVGLVVYLIYGRRNARLAQRD